MSSSDTTPTIDNNNNAAVVTTTTAHAVRISQQIKDTVRILIMREQSDALSSVMAVLNGDADGKNWEMVKREPSTLIAMLMEEYSRRLGEQLLILRKEKEEKGEGGDQKE